MKSMFDRIDDWLEDRYGGAFQLHPNRPQRGRTSNREADGLFNIGAAFSLGYGSELGRGYVIRVEMSTLEHIPKRTRKQIESDVENLVREDLPRFFPGQSLTLERDGNLLKIIGDFNLGSVIVK